MGRVPSGPRSRQRDQTLIYFPPSFSLDYRIRTESLKFVSGRCLLDEPGVSHTLLCGENGKARRYALISLRNVLS